MTPNEARDAARDVLRELDENARLQWEERGPPNTAIRWLQGWIVRPDGKTMCLVLVTVYGDRHGEETGGGWTICPEVGAVDRAGVLACLRGVDAYEAGVKAAEGEPVATVPQRELALFAHMGQEFLDEWREGLSREGLRDRERMTPDEAFAASEEMRVAIDRAERLSIGWTRDGR